MPGGRGLSRGWELTLLGLVLVSALCLRLAGLGSDLWYDEVVTLVEYARLPVRELLTTYTDQNQHVLYSLLAHLSLEVFGESAWAVRLPAAVLGVAGVWATWLLVRALASRWEALITAALVAASYHHVWYSQNARGYTGLLLWSTLGTWFFLRGMQRREGGSSAKALGIWSGYALCFALAFYTHLTAIFVFGAHALIWAAVGIVRLRYPLSPAVVALPGARGPAAFLGFVGGSLATLALYAPLLLQIYETFEARAGEQPAEVRIQTWTSPLWGAWIFLQGLLANFGNLGALSAAAFLGGIGLASVWRERRFPVVLALVPVGLALAFLFGLERHLYPRYFLFDIGFALWFLARGALATGNMLSLFLSGGAPSFARPSRLGVAFALVLVAGSLATLPKNYALPKQDYTGARAFLEARMAPEDKAASVGIASVVYSRYYAPEWAVLRTTEDLDALLAAGGQVWLVHTFPDHLESAFPELARRLAGDFELVRTFPGTLGGGALHVLRSKTGAQEPEDDQPENGRP